MRKRFGSDEEIEKQVSNRTKITHENEEWAFCYNANNKAVGLDCFFSQANQRRLHRKQVLRYYS